MYTKVRAAANVTVWYKNGHMIAEQYDGQLPCLYVDDKPRIYGAYRKDKFAKTAREIYGLAAAFEYTSAEDACDVLVDAAYAIDAIVDGAAIIPATYYYNVVDDALSTIHTLLWLADNVDLRVKCREALDIMLPIMDELKSRLNG